MAKVSTLNRSVAEVEKDAEQIAANAIALHPDLPATNLVEKAIGIADEALMAEVDTILRAQYFLRLIRTVRVKGTKDHQQMQWLFSGLRKAVTVLPSRVPIGEGRRKPLSDLNFEDLKRYLKVLNANDKARHVNNTKIVAVKELMKLWPARNKKNRGLTLKDVDARKAGTR